MFENVVLRYFMLTFAVFALFGIQKVSHSACWLDVQRGHGFAYPNYNCEWARGNAKCNDDSECCPGKRCSSFGYCQACT